MTTLKVSDLAAEQKKLAALQIRLPERVRRLRDKIDEAQYEIGHQRLLVKWYTWVTQLIEALGPDWRITGDGSYVDGYADTDIGDGEVYIRGEIELEREDEGAERYTLCIEDVGGAHLFWECPTTEKGMELILFGESAAHVASVINAKVAEVRALAKEKA